MSMISHEISYFSVVQVIQVLQAIQLKSRDASKTSASVTQLSSYLVNLKTTLLGSPYQSIFFSTKALKSSKRKVKLPTTNIVNNSRIFCASFKFAVVLSQAKQKVVMLRDSI